MSSCFDQSNSRQASSFRAVADLIEIAGAMPGTTVVVVGGERVEDLRLVESARDHGIVERIMLIGDRNRIRQAVDEVGIDVAPDDILSAGGEQEAAAAAVGLIESGVVDIVLKGSIATPLLNRHMLPLAQRRTVSLVTVFDAAPIAGGRPIVMTDAGVTTDCSLERMQDLITNALEVARVILPTARPRVAVLSANEKQIASLPSTKMGADLTELAWPDAFVYGPLSFDLATDPRSVAIKGLPDSPLAAEVAGRADVLVCPGIDSANVLYKSIAAMNKYGLASLANVTIGFPVPYIILSRADTLETRLESIALSSIVAHRTGNG
jgi:phosphotransacetylase